jgi:hypothetical protein
VLGNNLLPVHVGGSTTGIDKKGVPRALWAAKIAPAVARRTTTAVAKVELLLIQEAP